MLDLKIGQVYHLWCRGCRHPSNKFHVVAAVDPVPRYFIVNSAVPAFQAADQEMLAHQVPLTLGEHAGFLKHDSFLDCTEMLGGISGSELEDLHAANPRIYCGDLSTNARRHVRHVIANSILLTERDKKLLLALW